MGCPGNASGPSLGTERIGAVTWGVGYNYPNVYQKGCTKQITILVETND